MKTIKRLLYLNIVLLVSAFFFCSPVIADCLEDYDTAYTHFGLTENDPMYIYASATEYTGSIQQVIFAPWETGNWELSIANLTLLDISYEITDPKGYVIYDIAWTDYCSDDPWHVWTDGAMFSPNWRDIDLYSGSPCIAYRMRFCAENQHGSARVRVAVYPK